ncbi:MAG TPA: N-acetyl-alpha-D-glucosaminyl L-malate synthase BshA [Thermoanaerobaculia bacterium]|nr:N-acetyl-alpha-D-glucosaminyl L-malate synthase BshA [Thermoanaerobaculia bacterium]
MRVGITCYPTFGGSGVVATELGIALAHRGIDVHFISYALPSRLSLLHERIRFHEVSMMNYPLFDAFPPYTLALATKMAEVAAYEELDILHVHYAIPHAISAYLAKQMIADHPLRVVTTLHGTDITLVGRDPGYLPITKFGIESSDGVTAVSESLRQETIASLSVDAPIEVIHNFVDPARFRRSDSFVCRGFIKPGERLLGHVSNFRPVKRVIDVLEVFLRVNRKTPARLVMVGDGPERSRAEAFCRDQRIAERVLFLGNVPELEEVVGSFDLFLLPSETESFGMAALEALASEVPVIASRAGGLPEVVDHGVNGYLTPVGAVDEMAERALELLSDDEKRRRFGVAGRAAATERFHVDRIVPKYIAFYEEVMKAERRQSLERRLPGS